MHLQSTPVQLALFPAEKRCGKCKRLLPLVAYGAHTRAADGLQWCCKDCQHAYHHARKDEVNARQRQRRHDLRKQVLGDAYDDAARLLAQGLKRCSRCGEALPLDAFPQWARAKDGRRSECRICYKTYLHAWYQAHHSEQLAASAAYQKSPAGKASRQRSRERHREHNAQRGRAYREANKEALQARQSAYYAQHREAAIARAAARSRTPEAKAWQRAYYAAHKDEKARYDRAYRAANAERRALVRKQWYARNPEAVRRLRERYAAANRARVSRHYKAHPDAFKARAHQRRVRLMHIPGSFSPADIAAIRAAQHDRCAYCGAPLAANAPIEHMTPVTKGGTNWPWNLCVACAPCNRRKFTKTAGQYLALLLKERRAQAAV